MRLELTIRRAFLRRVLSTARGRAHVLSLMVAAEEGDEAGVFDRLVSLTDDVRTAKTIRRHQDDERRHAEMYRACIARNGLEPEVVPDELQIIRRVGREAGGAFATGIDDRCSAAIDSARDVMDTYALLLAIERRGVAQFPIIGAEFRRRGDHETADTFERVAKDELRHTKYCEALGRRYAPDEATWQRAVKHFAAVEDRAFKQVGLATFAYALEQGLAGGGWVGKALGRWLRRLDPLAARRATPEPIADPGTFFSKDRLPSRQVPE